MHGRCFVPLIRHRGRNEAQPRCNWSAPALHLGTSMMQRDDVQRARVTGQLHLEVVDKDTEGSRSDCTVRSQGLDSPRTSSHLVASDSQRTRKPQSGKCSSRWPDFNRYRRCHDPVGRHLWGFIQECFRPDLHKQRLSRLHSRRVLPHRQQEPERLLFPVGVKHTRSHPCGLPTTVSA